MEQYIIPAMAAVTVAIIEAVAANGRKQAKAGCERANERAKVRAEESRLSMQMMSATLQLSIVSANALTNGHNNGNVERAKAAAEEAMRDYEKFLRSVASKEVTMA